MNVTLLCDFISGKNVQKNYEYYMESQWFSISELAEIQSRKLQALMEHCYTNVPFYQRVMKDKGLIPSDFSSIKSLNELPVISKEDIKGSYDDFTPANLKLIRGVKSGQTGGTTGSILVKRSDANTRSSIWGAFKRFENWMGYRSGDRALILMGGHVIQHRNFAHFKDTLSKAVVTTLQNQIVINPYSTDPRITDQIVEALCSKNVKLVRGYSQYMFNLCQILKTRGIRASVPLITTTAEPLMNEHRIEFKDVLGADSFDQYGCGEVGGIAFECAEHEGMHITEERVIVEQIDNHDLVLTDLDNYSMPFVRYSNADQAVISEKKCSCGREHRLIKRVMGRTCDYVIGLNGEYLHWAYFWHLVFDSGISKRRDLRKFQVVQESRNEIIFRYVADKLSIDEERVLTDNIKSRLSGINVVYSQESDIPNTVTGKYRPVVNKLLR